jgi:cytochrome P450
MVHPDVQNKLHNELDERVGRARMPTMKEIEGLEYLQAAWSESMRWIAPVPIGNLLLICLWMEAHEYCRVTTFKFRGICLEWILYP